MGCQAVMGCPASMGRPVGELARRAGVVDEVDALVEEVGDGDDE